MCYDPRLPPPSHQSLSAAQETTCAVYVSFCDVLPNIYCPNSMFCELIAGDDTNPYSFGQFNRHLKYDEGELLLKTVANQLASCLFFADPNGGGFFGYLGNGTATRLCPKGLTAAVKFVCDKNAVWDGNDITQYVVANPDYNDCQVSHQLLHNHMTNVSYSFNQL